MKQKHIKTRTEEYELELAHFPQSGGGSRRLAICHDSDLR